MPNKHPTALGVAGEQPPISVGGTAVNLSRPNGHADCSNQNGQADCSNHWHIGLELGARYPLREWECPSGTLRANGSLSQKGRAGELMAQPGSERDEPAKKGTQEEAERLRRLLQDTEPADLADLSVLQRIGKTIARAARPVKRRLG
jgi:hypothetical protein